MKIRIKTYNGELPEIFTNYKHYDVIDTIDLNRVVIIANNSFECVVSLSSCKYLNGGSWEVVSE